MQNFIDKQSQPKKTAVVEVKKNPAGPKISEKSKMYYI